jgi:hypothetical protein
VLTQYLTRTAQLLQNPAAPQTLYSESDLTGFINEARGQLAGTAECIRAAGLLVLTQGTIPYLFSGISGPAGVGLGSVIHVRNLWQMLGSGGYHYVAPRPYPWYAVYEANNPLIQSQQGPPDIWSQYAQGVAGSLYISPAPDQTYTCTTDSVWLPAALATDGDPEAIPSLWTDAVPFLAAWFALLASQTGVRSGEADKMLQRYGEFMSNARRSATPDILPDIWDQAPSPVRQNQLGIAPHPRGGGGQQPGPG